MVLTRPISQSTLLAGSSKIRVSQPAGLGFDAAYGGDIDLSMDLHGSVSGTHSGNPMSAPSGIYADIRNGAKIYVSTTGNDSTGNGSLGNPYRTVDKAVSMMTGLTTIFMAAGTTYTRTGGGRLTVAPAYPVAFVASGGLVTMGVWDSYTWSQNTGTFPALSGNVNVWAIARSTFGRAVSPKFMDRFGNMAEYTVVSSVAICNLIPGSVYSDGTNIYCNPFNGEAASDSTIRVYLAQGAIRLGAISAPVDMFFDGETGSDAFSIEGDFTLACSAVPASKKILGVRNVRQRFGGGSGAVYNGIAVDGWHGLAFFERCSSEAPWVDGFNFHNVVGATMSVVTLNCSSRDNGKGGSGNQSCNGLTLHENVKAIDIAGDYSWSRGGTIRNINTSKHLLAGTSSSYDQGDRMQGGAVDPVQVRADDAAEIWMDRCRLTPASAGSRAVVASTGAAVHSRNMSLSGLLTGGGGTIDTY